MKFLCCWFGHKWEYTGRYIRECKRCGYEEAVFINRSLKIGEAQSNWEPSPQQRILNAEAAIEKEGRNPN